jgi:hypothetical protein
VSDATGLPAEHPALVSTVGPPGVPPAGDATGLPAEHPALVSVAGFAAPATPAPARNAALVVVAPRKDPGLFRRRGLGVTFVLAERAHAEVVLVRGTGRRRVKLSRTRRGGLRAGRSRIRLRASIAGRAATRSKAGVHARVLVRLRYRDGTTETAERAVLLRAPRQR